MTIQIETAYEISPEDEHELIRMLRVLRTTSGFQLLAAQCDRPVTQKACIRWIEQRAAGHGKEIVVIDLTLKQIDDFHTHLQAELKNLYAKGMPRNLMLMVIGLEWSIMLDHGESPVVLQQLNAELEQIQQTLPYPTVLWLPGVALQKWVRLNPDFSSWEEKVYLFTQASDHSPPPSESEIDEIRLLKRLRAELPNLTDDTPGEIKRLHRDWAYRLGKTYQAVGGHDQALPLLMKAADLDPEDTWQHTVQIYHAIGVSFWQSSQIDRAIHSFGRALSLAQGRNDRYIAYTALGNLGTIYNDLSNYETAIEYYEKALAISREIGARQGEAVLLGNLGVTHDNQGNLESSIRYHEEAIIISREVGDANSEAKHLGNLGGVYGKRGDWLTAIDYFERALSISQAIGDRRAEGAWLGNLGATYSHLGDNEAAVQCYHHALLLSREIGDRQSEGLWLGKLGLTHRQLGNNKIALACYNALEAVGIAIGVPQIIAWVEEDVGRLKAEVGEEAFERLKSEVQGNELTP